VPNAVPCLTRAFRGGCALSPEIVPAFVVTDSCSDDGFRCRDASAQHDADNRLTVSKTISSSGKQGRIELLQIFGI
jgi:hypothetical protein